MSPDVRRHAPVRLRLWILAATFTLLPLAMSCAGTSHGQPSVDTATPPFGTGQILSAATGQPVRFEPWLDELAAADVIYLGEEHHNRSHVEAAVRMLQALMVRGHQPVLALEMFAWDSQPSLDRYVADRQFSTEEFLNESRWEHNWGGPFADYSPLVTFAREQRITVLALNPPRALVRQVSRDGLAKALQDPEMARWGMQRESFVDDPAYRERIVGPLRRCHGGMPDDDYERMYEASLFRDEGMAKTIAGVLHGAPNGRPVVSYTGGGHIQYRVPVPNRVRRRIASARQISVYLAAYEPRFADEIRDALRDGIADYVWLTPLGAHGPPRRCK